MDHHGTLIVLNYSKNKAYGYRTHNRCPLHYSHLAGGRKSPRGPTSSSSSTPGGKFVVIRPLGVVRALQITNFKIRPILVSTYLHLPFVWATAYRNLCHLAIGIPTARTDRSGTVSNWSAGPSLASETSLRRVVAKNATSKQNKIRTGKSTRIETDARRRSGLSVDWKQRSRR